MIPEAYRQYGLREAPFTPDPDPRYTFLSCSFRNILLKCEYAVERNLGPAVTYGPSGTGKTILARILWQRYVDHPGTMAVLMSGDGGFQSPNRFLRAMLTEFRTGKTARAMEDSYAIFIDFLRGHVKQGHSPVLIIDDADELTSEDLLLLTRLDGETSSGTKLLRLILFGGFRLRTVVDATPDFCERVSFVSYQESLSFEEMLEMLKFEWQLAGGLDLPFEHQALEAVYRKSLGNPLKINEVAAHALQRANGRTVTAADCA